MANFNLQSKNSTNYTKYFRRGRSDVNESLEDEGYTFNDEILITDQELGEATFDDMKKTEFTLQEKSDVAPAGTFDVAEFDESSFDDTDKTVLTEWTLQNKN